MISAKESKLQKIQELISSSKKFNTTYRNKTALIAKMLVFANEDLIDRVYAFLLLESNQAR